MKVRALDVNGDWTFGVGLQNYSQNLDALEQSISTRLKQWKYNCFFATEEGVDWNNLLDIGTQALLDLDIKRVVLQTGGVLRITDYSSTIDTMSRNVSIQATINTVYGNLAFSEVV